MQVKHLIIVAILGILGLIAFNWMQSSHNEEQIQALQADTQVKASATAATPRDDVPLGQQPKATLDKANTQINQANDANADKVAQAEKATQ